MSFAERRALLTLGAIGLVVAGYVAIALRHAPINVVTALPGLIGAVILLVVIIIVSHIALVIAVGAKEARRPSDERDRLVQLASRRNAGIVGNAGLWIVAELAVTAASHLTITYVALGLFVIGQAVMYGSELFYYRRGV